ncbi:sugar ABC transporter ATP-binding protein [Actinocorallia sp. A-T 12471]|uniref:sugar ABC transporter ATP-binding protein n=1 Tax=Actinocorallia sp. A-T 12471 TaxID=3089813 RepID=UPI0029CB54EF|nr:sugar ABC transporter ATP-binding protein [Actinocorallia sp. A-T 12471]MDX6740194.1 sugar ABC transporter ATP-binding protein [Actinocorallia sp. A-T 12471]
MTGLSKGFAGVRALQGVSLELPGGQITALMGENGAGKSTLIKIINGDYQPDDGVLTLDGQVRDWRDWQSPADARRGGVRVIAQEPEIIPYVSVAENIYVGALPHGATRRLDSAALRRRVRDDLDRYGFTGMLDPDARGDQISAAQRQLVEILRALTDTDPNGGGGPRVLAFDEPTSSLGDRETEALFTLIRRLRDEGRAILYVSHRMREILQLADRVAVLRDGSLVGVREAADVTEGEIVRMMVGRDLSAMFERERLEPGPVVLSAHGVSTDDVHGIDLEVRAGEVVVLAGLVGAGRSELVSALVGDVPLREGEVRVDGKALRLRHPGDAVRAGIGYAPEERKKQALFMERSVRDNASLAILKRLRRLRFVSGSAERRAVQEYVTRMRVRTPSIEQHVGKLSGGNQQKVVLARWMARNPRVLILDEPTRGVDVGAKAEIYDLIAGLAKAGVAVLVVSSELPEALGLADRIVVMQNGRVTGELDRADAGEEAVLALAMSHDLTSSSTGDTP